uniref:Heterogeneous nuclear ribonucleoprotein K n=1 Tax=Macrostomum lignano TaxID=282301 RepID=A0A1I8HGC3_9PLAT
MEAVKFAELKREQPDPMDHTNEPPSKRQYAGSGARNEMRFLIPSKMAGVIIGKGGANIKRLREEFSAKVSVPDSNGPERVLCLEGEQPMLESLLADVLNTMVVEGNSGRGDRDGLGTQQGAVTNTGDVDLRLLVHQSQAGCIIGKGGSKIKELREESKLRALKVYSVACPVSTDRMIGAPAELLGAVRMVSELLESAPPKGQIAGYDARNFDEFGAEQYGGWPGRWGVGRQDHSVAASAVGMPPGPPGYPPGGALAAAAAAAHMRGGVAPPPPQARGLGPPVGVPMAAGGAAGGMPYGAPRAPRVPAGPEVTQQVSIPDSLTGSIMGRGGQRIKQIRMESGADIKIDRGDPGQDRIITIRGTQEQIQNAQYLLQMCVKKYSGQY